MERRIDLNDGGAFTREEFIAYYGGTYEWELSARVHPENCAPQRQPSPRPENTVADDDLYVTRVPPRGGAGCKKAKRGRNAELPDEEQPRGVARFEAPHGTRRDRLQDERNVATRCADDDEFTTGRRQVVEEEVWKD